MKEERPGVSGCGFLCSLSSGGACRVPQEGPQEAADLVRACCLTNPRARPTADALVEILALMQ